MNESTKRVKFSDKTLFKQCETLLYMLLSMGVIYEIERTRNECPTL